MEEFDTLTLARRFHTASQEFGKTDDLGTTTAASATFQDDCDDYEAWSFEVAGNNGRTYVVVVEDVTIKEGT